MSTILQVVQQIQATAATWTSVEHVYTYPPESINEPGLVALVYAGGANHVGSTCSPLDRMTSTETVVVELLWPRAYGVAVIMEKSYAYLNSVPPALINDTTLRDLIFAISSIDRKFPWQRKHDGIDHLGIRWDVKVRMDSSLT
jgi:hypothetical protein